jgi:TonB family protein
LFGWFQTGDYASFKFPPRWRRDRTQAAIRQFQKDKYLPADGLITNSLVDHLRAAEILLVHPQWELPLSTRNPTKAPIKKSVVSASEEVLGPRLIHAQMIGSCNPTYPADAARSAQVGTTVLEVRVGTDGGVTSVDVASSSGSESLDRAAVTALEQCRFIPASQNGEPVVDELRVPVSFNFDRQTVRSGTW